ncbi:hypothetical protein J6590_099170 [Homalodisca vitripennis]|nr:hypothetical protein J6590_099170 [Homalodisca vitripennis]
MNDNSKIFEVRNNRHVLSSAVVLNSDIPSDSHSRRSAALPSIFSTNKKSASNKGSLAVINHGNKKRNVGLHVNTIAPTSLQATHGSSADYDEVCGTPTCEPANCTKSPEDKQAYITARNPYKSAIRDAKKSTNEHVIDTSGNKTKAAWQVVKSLTGSFSPQSVISPSLEEFTTFYGGMVEELRQKIPSAATSADVLLKKIPRPNFLQVWRYKCKISRRVIRVVILEVGDIVTKYINQVLENFAT